MVMERLLGLGGVVIVVSGCQSWQIGDIESLPPTASLPETSEQGKVELRYYDDIPGQKVTELLESPKYPGNPDEIVELTSLEVVENRGDNYGALVRGYIVPSVSGEYTFFVSGDDETQLWLSTDTAEENLSLIASVTGWTSRQQYTKYTSQTSPIQSLSAGKRYFFELRLKEASGGDHFSVAWEGPGISQQVISSEYIYSLGKALTTVDFTTAEAYSLGYRVGFLDGSEQLNFNHEFPPLDEDQDGIYDNWEVVHGLDPTNPDDALSDPDNDLLVAADEFLIGTAENNPDSDGDGIPDGVEYAAGLNPLDASDASEDLDGDGFSNLEEFRAATNISNPDDMPEIDPVYLTGFVGQYYLGMNFEQFVTARHDPNIEFTWGQGSPMEVMPEDNFSVRWSGQFTAPHDTGNREYRFTTRTDDGTRLYLDSERVINDWSDHGATSFNHTETFEPGETTNLTIEYYENNRGAVAQFWITDVSTEQRVSIFETVQIPDIATSHSRDTDGDGIPDIWELRYGLNPLINDAFEISNSEGVSNLEAYESGLSPWTLEPVSDTESSADVPETGVTGGEPITLSWTGPLTRRDGSSIALSEIDYYVISFGQDPNNLSETQRVDGTESSFELAGLSSGTWYFTIRVVDNDGLSSPASEPVSAVVD